HDELDERENSAEDVEIELGDFLDVGVLHLDGNLTTVVRHRPVYLRKRRAGDRYGIERREKRVGRRPELLTNPRRDFGERPRRNAVLKLLQLGPELLRQKVCENTDELADFDEQPAKLEDGAGQPLGVRAVPGDEPCVVETGPEYGSPDAKPGVAG